jgi:cell wall-associated NlpC family hydrolase
MLALVAVVAFAMAVSLVVPALGTTERASAVPAKRSHAKRRAQRKAAHVLGKGARAARIALREVGVPYVWGGSNPRGFDCSGLVRFAYGRVGIWLPHSSYALYGHGRQVGRSQLQVGDLLFFDGLGHVGIYLGQGRMVHAPQMGRSVEVVKLAGSYGTHLVGARRVVPNLDS